MLHCIVLYSVLFSGIKVPVLKEKTVEPYLISLYWDEVFVTAGVRWLLIYHWWGVSECACAVHVHVLVLVLFLDNKFVYTTLASRRRVSARRQKRYAPTKRLTDQPTDGRTHPLIELWLTTNKWMGLRLHVIERVSFYVWQFSPQIVGYNLLPGSRTSWSVVNEKRMAKDSSKVCPFLDTFQVKSQYA